MHVIRTYNASGKIMYEERFTTANKAYEAYKEMVDNSERNLPKGYETTVVRYDNEGRIMSIQTVVGKN